MDGCLLTLQLDNGGLELLEPLVDVVLRLGGDHVGRGRLAGFGHVAPLERAGRKDGAGRHGSRSVGR
jgi:hypothetical protein